MSPSTHRKRRRCATITVPGANSDSPGASSSWASLPEELVYLIGWRVLAGDLLDYVRLRAVCHEWRSATLSPRGRGLHDPRFHPRRWMMLPEGHGFHPGHGKLRGYIRFLNLSTGDLVGVRLPIFRDHCILDSVDGILLLQRDEDTAVRLLHPFTGDIAELPPLVTIMTELHSAPLDMSFYRTVAATAFGVGADGVVTVMIALDKLGMVGYTTTIDQQWKLSAWNITYQNRWRPISFQGKIYFLDGPPFPYPMKIFELDVPLHDDAAGADVPRPPRAPKLIATFPGGKLHAPYRLTECDLEILVIGRSKERDSAHNSVYRLTDIMLGRIAPITSIGENALFVEERVLSVSSRVHPTIAGDAIVTVHPHRQYLGQYHLADGTWLPTADGSVITSRGVPSPCSLIYHIFTCCNRATWNKGALLFQGRQPPNWRVKRKWREGGAHRCLLGSRKP